MTPENPQAPEPEEMTHEEEHLVILRELVHAVEDLSLVIREAIEAAKPKPKAAKKKARRR